MFRISQELREEVRRRVEENNCTITSYMEYLIEQDIEKNPRIEESALPRKRFVLKRG